MVGTVARREWEDALVGISTVEDGVELIDVLFRPTGRYQRSSRTR
jgi:hypothetical protein